MFDKLFGTGKNQPPGANPPIVSPPPVQATLSIAAAKERQYHPGDRIAGRYEVVKSLAGGMGIVYLCADHAEEGLPVALKTFKPRYLPDRTTRDRFLREGTIWVGLRNHPHIVRAYRVERLRGGLEVYLVLEWVAQAEGKEDASLRMWLQPNQPLEPEQSLRVALHIARGMNYAVTQIPGLVHRDLKPENILLGRDGNARVTDFGLASVVASLRASFKETAVRAKKRKILHGMSGTPLYMAPEQWKQNIQLDMRADIYAFGCILHEMLTGETAVAGSEPDELARAHLTGQTRHLPSEFPSELKALVRGCLAVELADRFQTWSDVETAVTLVYRRVAGQPPPPLEAVSDHDTPRSERVSAGWSYDAMGLSYRDIGNYDLAAGYFERVIWIAQTEQAPPLEAAGLSHLGDACHAMGDLQGAIQYHQKHLTLARKMDNQAGESDALGHLGNVYTDLGDTDQAITCYQKQLAIARQTQDLPREGLALSNMGDVHRQQGDTQKALNAYKRALTIARQIENRFKEGRLIGKIGLIYADLNQTDQAITCYEQALTIAKDIGDRSGEGYALGNLGLVHRALNDFRRAIWYFINHLAITHETRDRVGEGRVLNNLGDVYVKLDNLDQALESYQTALTIARKIGSRPWQGQLLSRLGRVHRKRGEPRKAIGYYEESLTIVRDTGDLDTAGQILYRLGNAYRDTHDLRRAHERYEEALLVARQTENKRFKAKICFDFAVSLAFEDQQDEAIHHAELAADIFKELGETQHAKKAKDLIAEIKPRRRWF